jgi:hypothetical protein
MKIIEIREKSVFLKIESVEEYGDVIRFIRKNWKYLRMKEMFPDRIMQGFVNVPKAQAENTCTAQNKPFEVGTSLNVITWW